MIDLYLINTNMYIYNLSLFYLKVSYLYFVFKVYVVYVYSRLHIFENFYPCSEKCFRMCLYFDKKK